MDHIFSVKINGKNIEQNFPINNITISKGINKVPYCSVRIYEAVNTKNELFIDNSLISIGSKVDIEAINKNNELENIFSGILLDILLDINNEFNENFVELKCYSKAHQMDIAKNSTCFLDKTDSDILKSIISKYGLQSDIGDMSLKHEFIYQNDLTDWDFIVTRAELYGYVVNVDNDKIIVNSPKKKSSNVRINFSDIISANIKLDSNSQINSINAKIWDIKTQEVKEIKNSTQKENSFGNIKSDDIVSKTGKHDSNLSIDSLSEDETKKILNGFIDINRFSKICGYVVINGNTELKPNTTLNLNKCGKVFTGDAYINFVQYMYNVDDCSWRVKLYIGINKHCFIGKSNAEDTNKSITSNINNLKYGKVIKISEDPESNYRIFVTIPTINNKNEGVWCRLSSLYASNKGGILFIPEKDDEVIVGFIDGNASSPIVVGSVYSSKNKPSVEIESENGIKSIKTNNELEINFNDKDKIINIKTGEKRSIVISEKDSNIEIVNENDKITIGNGIINLEADKEISIKSKDIDINASGNVKIKAGSNVSVEGNNIKINGSMGANIKGGTSSKFESSGITEIKGSIVKIN